MTRDNGFLLRPVAALLIAVVLIAAGAGIAWFLVRRGGDAGGSAPAAPPAGGAALAPSRGGPEATRSPAGPAHASEEIAVLLTAQAIARAGIVSGPVSVRAASRSLRLPGIVEPNAYKQVDVTPLVSGRITTVAVDLGQRVRRGQELAQIYSPELAEAHTRFVSARAELDAHDRALQRTERLVEIGAASRQELERIHAEHAAQTAAVQTARTRLELLGLTDAAVDAMGPGQGIQAATVVPAPIDGLVIDRVANPGLNVDPSMKLFTVVDLRTVWILADLYERDFPHVAIGSEVTVTTTAYPGRELRGTVNYIDPQVSRETRTARLRVEVPNARGELRLGMYAEVVVGSSQARQVVIVPSAAIQNVGDRTVVFVADAAQPGRFVERPVTVGRVGPDDTEIEAGLTPDDVVVTKGSFFVRAELERMGVRGTSSPGDAAPRDQTRGASERSSAGAPASPATPPAGQQTTEQQTAAVAINAGGFAPAQLTLRAGVPARVTFTRMTDETCATAVVFPSLKIRRDLPLKQPVAIDFTPSSGELQFACGMNMFKGTIVVR